jgi:hypothetical protein
MYKSWKDSLLEFLVAALIVIGVFGIVMIFGAIAEVK